MTPNELKQKFKQECNCNILYWSENIKDHYIAWLEDRIYYLDKKIETLEKYKK